MRKDTQNWKPTKMTVVENQNDWSEMDPDPNLELEITEWPIEILD